jgi:D-alanyl-lipoteichoic acid acyltransferase DltB (MBOAT superfamily)
VLFPTVDFALFFALVFVGHWFLNARVRVWKWFMIGASYVFYAWWDWRFVPLLAGVSALTQVGALAVVRTADKQFRRWTLGIACASILAPLAYFKYYGFFAVTTTNVLGSLGVSASPIPLIQVVLPVGVSFFTFMAISYVVDIYRGDTQAASTVDVFLYLSFFPHLVAGPIVRPNELIPQLDVARDARRIDVAGATWLIFGGLFKKVVISSFLTAQIVDPVFGEPTHHSALETLFAIWGYAVVIYADFSGYTDIAIGVARMLGFEFPKNFDRPYSARSIQEFWRRWHMTLSRWLRDYLYIPLGGSRRSERRTYINLLLTMTLGGLWHGAAWTFVLWGGLHGAYLAVGRLIGRLRESGRLRTPAETTGRVWLRRAITFHLVCFGWVLFRSDSLATAGTVLGRLVTGWLEPNTLLTPGVVMAIGLMLALQFAPRSPAAYAKAWLARLQPVALGLVLAFALFAITAIGPRGVAPFIYFQF